MAKRNIMIGVTAFEFENMPELFIGKYTLGVEGLVTCSAKCLRNGKMSTKNIRKT